MIKTVNLLRILSIILFLIVFALAYAYMPVMVSLSPVERWEIHRESFFYFGSGSFLLVNIVTWIIVKYFTPALLQSKGEEATAWMAALPFVINIYITMIIGFLGVLNNPTRIPPDNYSYLNFIGPVIFFLWIGGLIYFLTRKK